MNSALARRASRTTCGHELEFANTIVKGCTTYAAQLAEHGWTADDTTALSGYVATLEGDPALRDTASDTKKRITSARNSGANDLYKVCLSVQNAARLAYPITQAGKVAGVTEARARYLLDEFPPDTRQRLHAHAAYADTASHPRQMKLKE